MRPSCRNYRTVMSCDLSTSLSRSLCPSRGLWRCRPPGPAAPPPADRRATRSPSAPGQRAAGPGRGHWRGCWSPRQDGPLRCRRWPRSCYLRDSSHQTSVILKTYLAKLDFLILQRCQNFQPTKLEGNNLQFAHRDKELQICCSFDEKVAPPSLPWTWLRPDVHTAQSDVEVGGAVSAVGRGEDEGGGDETAGAEPGRVDEEGGRPGELALLRRLSSDDERTGSGRRSLHATPHSTVNISTQIFTSDTAWCSDVFRKWKELSSLPWYFKFPGGF